MKIIVTKENNALPVGSVGEIHLLNKKERLIEVLNGSMWGTFYYILPLDCVKFIGEESDC